jgi:hypothetical protein
VNGKHLPKALLLDETLDAATPFSGSLRVRKLFPSTSLIAIVGGTSNANPFTGNLSVDDRVAAYLADGTVPRRPEHDTLRLRVGRGVHDDGRGSLIRSTS